MSEIILNITGMKCGGCVSAVENAIKELDAVDTVSVSLEDKQAVVNGNVEKSELIKVVEAAGFKAE